MLHLCGLDIKCTDYSNGAKVRFIFLLDQRVQRGTASVEMPQ